MNYQPKPKSWFIERVGQRIYRDGQEHCCSICSQVEDDGLVIRDEMQADYLAMVDICFASEGLYMNYRDEK